MWNVLKFVSNLSRRICFVFVKRRGVPNHVVFLVNEVPKFYNHDDYFEIRIYEQNFEKILECADWCLCLGIEEMSAYTFSCLKFKFPKEEIGKVILAFENTLHKWIENEKEFDRKSIRVRIIDLFSVLPTRTVAASDKVCYLSRNNTKICVNIILGWIGDKEISDLTDEFESQIKHGILNKIAATKEIFLKRLMNYEIKEPDLIISNCQYKRVTDYLIWKVPSRYIHHLHVAWHFFNALHFVTCLLFFQNHRIRYLKRIKDGEFIESDIEEEEV